MEKYFSGRSNITKEAFINAVESLGGIRNSYIEGWGNIIYKINDTAFTFFRNGVCREFKSDSHGLLTPIRDYYTLYDLCLELLHANGTNPEDVNTELEKLLAQGYNEIGHAFYKEHEGWFVLSSKCPNEYGRLSKLLGEFDSLVFPFSGDSEIKFVKAARNYHIQHGHNKHDDCDYFQLTPIEQDEHQLITRLHTWEEREFFKAYRICAEAQFVYGDVTYYICHTISSGDEILRFITTSKNGVKATETFYVSNKEATFENVSNVHIFDDMSEHFNREIEWRINVLRTILPFE